ncbi:MAG: 50S ribosomal protein L17 [Planctomycetota bacterium]|nr:50S ribosomal protein L17 [Planctomycetota bacterium]
MRHRVAGKKLNRTSSHRKALVKNLMRAFVIEWQGKGHIVTTRTKAKFIQPKIEKLISLSRNKTVHNIRRAMSLIGDRDVVQVLFDEIGPYYSDRPGGYTRVLRLVKPRLGDATVRAYLGYVREDDDYPEGDRRSRGATSDSEGGEVSSATAVAVEDSSDSSEETVVATIVDEDSGEASAEAAPETDPSDEETPK